MHQDNLTWMIGELVLIRLRPGLDERWFGSGWRIGTVLDAVGDFLTGERMLILDDGEPSIYTGHIDFLERLGTGARS